MKLSQDLRSLGQPLVDLVRVPVSRSPSDRDPSYGRFSGIIVALIMATVGVVALGLGLTMFPQYAGLIWLAQLLCLVVLLGSGLASLIHIHKSFSDPVGHLRRWASEIRQGDFSARVPVAMGGEFARLTDDINRLAEWLESLADDAEEQLRQQTERLASKSQSMQLLYDVSALVNQAPGNEELVGQYLKSLQTMLDARVARAYLSCATGMRLVSAIGARPDGAEALDDEEGEAPPVTSDGEQMECIVVPLAYKEQLLGRYELYFDSEHDTPAADVVEVLPDIGRHLGMAMEKTRLEQEAIGLSAMQERARVANELHDSLAQTLAGLKLQVRVLDETISQGHESVIWSQLERVENSLEEATQELRDLIAQFRGSGDSPQAMKSIENVLATFRRRSNIDLFFHNDWDGVDIPVEWERETAKVIQEALANAQKHSKASAVRVLLRRAAPDVVEAIIEDDGVGFERPAASAHPGVHIGLSIMQERAEQVGGELVIDSEPGEGTRVLLRMHLPQTDGSAGKLAGGA